MAKALNISVGTRFGNLTVIREAEKTEKNRRQFLCKCDCGNKKVIPLERLRSGSSKSCGCRGTNLRKIKIDDYIGKRYGKLVIIGEGTQKRREPYRVICKCDCGTVKEYELLNLKNKCSPTRSCGCGRKVHDGIQNRCKEKLYKTYTNMKMRCYNPNNKGYHNYGGRGIKVCDEWFESYPKFRSWALANGYKDGLSLDRINNDGNYEPTNCRWVDMKVQSNNRRTNVYITYNNETHTLTQWSEITGIHFNTLSKRYRRGLKPEEILSPNGIKCFIKT